MVKVRVSLTASPVVNFLGPHEPGVRCIRQNCCRTQVNTTFNFVHMRLLHYSSPTSPGS